MYLREFLRERDCWDLGSNNGVNVKMRFSFLFKRVLQEKTWKMEVARKRTP